MTRKLVQQRDNIDRLSADRCEVLVTPSRYCVISLGPDGLIQIRGTDTDVDFLMDSLEKSGFNVKWDYKSYCG